MNDSTKVTYTQVYNDFKDALNGVAGALKVGAEHVYEVLVKQQFVNSITLIVVSIILFTAGGICLKYGLKNMWHEVRHYGETNNEIKETNFALLLISGTLLAFAVVITSVNMSSIITGIVNPEYGAIMEIKQFIR